MHLILRYLSAYSIIICFLNFSNSPSWIAMNICPETQWHKLIIYKKTRKKERKAKESSNIKQFLLFFTIHSIFTFNYDDKKLTTRRRDYSQSKKDHA